MDELELVVFEAMVAELVLAFVGEVVAVLELVVSFWFSFRTCALRCCSANLAFDVAYLRVVFGLNSLLGGLSSSDLGLVVVVVMG